MPDQCDIIEWSRTSADDRLTLTLDKKRTLLIYPEAKLVAQQIQSTDDLSQFDTFIILDGTWQEARKMYNKSAYLQQAKKISLKVEQPSAYCLRRNQIEGGLSTAECVIHLLKKIGNEEASTLLQAKFQAFNFR